MGTTAGQLREEIDQKREDASRKIDEIESRIESTTEQVRDEVRHTTEQVKESLNLKHQIEERPLVALGIGLVGGFLLGGMGSGGGDQHRGRRSGSSTRSELMGSLRQTSKETGLDDTLAAAAAALMASLTDQAKGLVGDRVAEITGDKGQGNQRTTVASEPVVPPSHESQARAGDADTAPA